MDNDLETIINSEYLNPLYDAKENYIETGIFETALKCTIEFIK